MRIVVQATIPHFVRKGPYVVDLSNSQLGEIMVDRYAEMVENFTELIEVLQARDFKLVKEIERLEIKCGEIAPLEGAYNEPFVQWTERMEKRANFDLRRCDLTAFG